MDVKRFFVFFSQNICCMPSPERTLTIFMIWPNLFPNAFAWVKVYTAYSHVFKLVQHILCTQVSDTEPMVLWFYIVQKN